MQPLRQSERTARQLRALIEHRLVDTHPSTDPATARSALGPELDPLLEKIIPKPLRAAAVLVPVVDRDTELTVLFTQRSSNLRTHAGQISFPGGRIEPEDPDALEAAIRETEEEIGLAREFITPAGYLDPHLAMSGFWITPVVAFVRPGFTLQVDHREVDETFEVPLEYILNPANHIPRDRVVSGVTVPTLEFDYDGRRIWGATANMLLSLYRTIEIGSR